MSKNQMVEFVCPGCHENLHVEKHRTAQPVSCPRCSTLIKVEVNHRGLDRGSGGDGVPVKMGLRHLGSFETTVSRKDAGRMGHTFLGGMLALLGVVLCAFLGINFSKKS
jgi:DNA-directed RNA polymerase subunit RPC12/RpoP